MRLASVRIQNFRAFADLKPFFKAEGDGVSVADLKTGQCQVLAWPYGDVANWLPVPFSPDTVVLTVQSNDLRGYVLSPRVHEPKRPGFVSLCAASIPRLLSGNSLPRIPRFSLPENGLQRSDRPATGMFGRSTYSGILWAK